MLKSTVHYLAILLLVATVHLCPGDIRGQVNGGKHVFQLLQLPVSARVLALGSAQPAVQDEDVALALENPAALHPAMHHRVALNHSFFISDIQYGYLGMGKHLPRHHILMHAAIRYLNYGEMTRADELGNQLGTFRAGETLFTMGAARKLSEKWSLGLNFHYANARFDVWHSSGLAADAGIFYSDTAHRTNLALVLKNIGIQLTTFAAKQENLPYDVQIAFTKKLKYMPFRYGIVAHHLHRWNIRYDDPNASNNDDSLFGLDNDTDKGNPFLDNLFRHLIFNGEFLFGKTEFLRLRFGYNHLRKRELTVNNFRSLAGFSGGIGLKINRLRVDLGWGAYHLAGSSVHLGMGMSF